eukprot:3258740-Ditylum_brightwellii.AAC.1
MAEDELCNILYRIVKHDWCDALCKLGTTLKDMSLEDLMDYFNQIELLGIVKQESKIIVVDDNNDKRKKLSGYCNKSAKSKENAKGKPPKKGKKRPTFYVINLGGTLVSYCK